MSISSKCKKDCQCNCTTSGCSPDADVHLHAEIEQLKDTLILRDQHIAAMEATFLEQNCQSPSARLQSLSEQLEFWQDKYRRLLDAHRRIQRVNQGLEDKLLRLVDVTETEKSVLGKDVVRLGQELAQSNESNRKLKEDNERYKQDVSIAIQFLQCKQSYFVSPKLESLPADVQEQVSQVVCGKRCRDGVYADERRLLPEPQRSIKVPIPTFPPTAMVYSVPRPRHDNNNASHHRHSNRHYHAHHRQRHSHNHAYHDDSNHIPACLPLHSGEDFQVSSTIMAKVLEERVKDRSKSAGTTSPSNSESVLPFHGDRHCATCTCWHTGTAPTPATDQAILPINDDEDSRITKADNSTQTEQSMANIPNAMDIQHQIVKVQPNNFLCDQQSLIEFPRSVIRTNTLLKRHKSVTYVRNSIDTSTLTKRYTNLDYARYSEMEANVKRFLLGEKSLLDYDGYLDGANTNNIQSSRSLMTKTKI